DPEREHAGIAPLMNPWSKQEALEPSEPPDRRRRPARRAPVSVGYSDRWGLDQEGLYRYKALLERGRQADGRSVGQEGRCLDQAVESERQVDGRGRHPMGVRP